VINRAVSNQIICMDFENIDVHVIFELEPYYCLILLRIPEQKKNSHYHKSGKCLLNIHKDLKFYLIFFLSLVSLDFIYL
jgi:hypothetical protein